MPSGWMKQGTRTSKAVKSKAKPKRPSNLSKGLRPTKRTFSRIMTTHTQKSKSVQSAKAMAESTKKNSKGPAEETTSQAPGLKKPRAKKKPIEAPKPPRISDHFENEAQVVADPRFLVEIADRIRQIRIEREEALGKAKTGAAEAGLDNDKIRLLRTPYDEIREMEYKATGSSTIRPEFIHATFMPIIEKRSTLPKRLRDFIQDLGTGAFFATIGFYEKQKETINPDQDNECE